MPLSADIVDIAEKTAFDLIFRFVIEAVVMALVTDREMLVELLGRARHFFTLDDRVAHELFAEDVKALAHRLDGRFRVKVKGQTDDNRLNTEFVGVVEKIAVIGVYFDVLTRFVFRLPAVLFHQTATRGERGVSIVVAVERAVLVVRTNVGDRDDLNKFRITGS